VEERAPTLVMAYESPVPPHGGYRLRILHLARVLAAAGQDVHVAALGPVPPAAEVDEPFRLEGVPHDFSRRRALVRSWRRPYLDALLASDRLGELAGARSWAVVQVSSPFFVTAARRAGVPVVLDAHNVEAEIMRTLGRTDPRRLHRARWAWEATKLERLERRMAQDVDAVVATSEADAEVFRQWGARRVDVVPNGVDTSEVPFRAPAPGAGLLFLGQFGYRPNEAAAVELAREVLPLVRRRCADATVELVGRNPTEAMCAVAGPGVTVTGPVPAVLPHLHAARALVVPLRAGSGTRLKILEAMAAGTPVVSTPLGAAGIGARDGQELLLGETPADLAEQAARVLEDDDLAGALATAARRLVEERYDWTVVGEPLVALHRELLAGRPA
jgi:glycosyltransferase involved in cell wall biosynthesis